MIPVAIQWCLQICSKKYVNKKDFALIFICWDEINIGPQVHAKPYSCKNDTPAMCTYRQCVPSRDLNVVMHNLYKLSTFKWAKNARRLDWQARVCHAITAYAPPLTKFPIVVKFYPAVIAVHSQIGEVTRASAEKFGSCNLTDFVEEAVGNCEKRFYLDLAQDRTADCRYATTIIIISIVVAIVVVVVGFVIKIPCL